MSSEDTRIKDRCVCPGCGTKNNGHMETQSADDEMEPGDGDYSICYYCGTISKYNVTDGIRTTEELTENEKADAMKNPELVRALEVLKKIHSGAGK